jgi:hypothetical protein
MMKYDCNLCDKTYKHRQSLYNHINKIHSVNKSNVSSVKKNDVSILSPLCNQNVSIMSPNSHHLNISNNSNKELIKVYKCNYCNKVYKHKQSKHKHLKNCNKKIEYEQELIELKKNNKELKKHNKELKKHNKELKKITKTN